MYLTIQQMQFMRQKYYIIIKIYIIKISGPETNINYLIDVFQASSNVTPPMFYTNRLYQYNISFPSNPSFHIVLYMICQVVNTNV